MRRSTNHTKLTTTHDAINSDTENMRLRIPMPLHMLIQISTEMTVEKFRRASDEVYQPFENTSER